MNWFKYNLGYYRCISCSFPNNLTNVIIYPKTRFFVLEGWDIAYLLEFIIVIIIFERMA